MKWRWRKMMKNTVNGATFRFFFGLFWYFFFEFFFFAFGFFYFFLVCLWTYDHAQHELHKPLNWDSRSNAWIFMEFTNVGETPSQACGISTNEQSKNTKTPQLTVKCSMLICAQAELWVCALVLVSVCVCWSLSTHVRKISLITYWTAFNPASFTELQPFFLRF